MRSFFVTCILSESEWGKLTKSAIMIFDHLNFLWMSYCD